VGSCAIFWAPGPKVWVCGIATVREACTVHMDGKSRVRACQLAASDVEGRDYHDRGLGNPAVALMPTQRGMDRLQVAQCGLLPIGQIIQAASFSFELNPTPNRRPDDDGPP